MTTTINLRRMLHRKSAEYCAPSPQGNTIAGGFVVSDKSNLIASHDIAYYVGGVSAIWNYNADQDAWQQMPNSGLPGIFGAGACGEFRAVSAPGGVITQTATGGSTTLLNTALTLTRDISGCEIRVIGGAGVGYIGTIASHTLGVNSVITVDTPSGTPFTATSQYQLTAGSLWFMNSGTSAVGFGVYDRATNTWTARSVVNLPVAWGTDGQLVSTPGRSSNNGAGFVNGTASATTATTLTDATMTWPVNGWTNSQVRINAGTGAGQVRTIASNTANALTVAAWTVTPDATSVYVIEGNDDFMYLLGNAAVAMYRFTISTNSWALITPGTARAAVPGGGMTADWIDGVAAAEWVNGMYAPHYPGVLHQNGRYIYSFRGAAGNILDVYDIAANTWNNGLAYGQQMETFGPGSCSVDIDGIIYIQKELTGRIYRFDVAKHVLEPFVLNPVPQGVVVAGDKMFMTTYTDGAAKINYLYTLGHTRPELTRWLVI